MPNPRHRKRWRRHSKHSSKTPSLSEQNTAADIINENEAYNQHNKVDQTLNDIYRHVTYNSYLQDSNNYVQLNESQDVMLLALLSQCIDLLQPFTSFKLQSEKTKNQIQDLRLLIKSKICSIKKLIASHTTKRAEKTTLICHYCGDLFTASNWRSHVLKCLQNPPSLKNCVYEINSAGLKCNVCNVVSLTINDKIKHDVSFIHNLTTLESDVDYIDWLSIYCSLCQEKVPNNNIQCHQHLQSFRHTHWPSHYLQWYKLDIGYVAYRSYVECLMCKVILKVGVHAHHSYLHTTDRGCQMLGLLQVPAPDNILCPCCRTIYSVQNFHLHSGECARDYLDYYCQICLMTITGFANFTEHVQKCEESAEVLEEKSFRKQFATILCKDNSDVFLQNCFNESNVACYYCRMPCLQEELMAHMALQCSSIFHSNGKLNAEFRRTSEECLYSLQIELECSLCRISMTWDELEAHCATLYHLGNIERRKDIDLDAIHCVTCQEDIPKENIYYLFHINSKKHKMLKNGPTFWFAKDVRYIIFKTCAKCLACDQTIDLKSVSIHCRKAHCKEKRQKGWCSQCGEVIDIALVKNHSAENCAKLINNYFCQNCKGTFLGQVRFINHVYSCFLD